MRMFIHRSTLQLLRFHFSFFLMPVFWFAMSQLTFINMADTLLVFLIIHGLVYPASNGYNSYMDRDESSIGGIKTPLQPTRQLFYITGVMDLLAISLSLLISSYFAAGILLYILVSRAYSYRGIRLKQYPFMGYLAVVVLQGAASFWLVFHGSSADKTLEVPLIPMIVASLLIGGSYPLTQIYQHDADRRDGITTLSYVLGYRGTFLYAGFLYVMAFVLLAYYFFYNLQTTSFYVFFVAMLPVVVYFTYWAYKTWRNKDYADYKHTMRMNAIASFFTNAAFIITTLKNYF